MDDSAAWPHPLPAEDHLAARAQEGELMRQMRQDPRALQAIGGARWNVLVVLAPLVGLGALALLIVQLTRGASAGWIAGLSALIVLCLIVFVIRLRAVAAQARMVLGEQLAGSVRYGVGWIQQVDLHGSAEPPAAEDDDASAAVASSSPSSPEEAHDDGVPVRLTIRVTPVRGPGFTAQRTLRYGLADAFRLERGQHGPVRYLLRDPEGTLAIETGLDREAVQRIYRAAALN